MQINSMLLKEHHELKEISSNLLTKFRVEYVFENHYFITASFGKKIYYTIAPDVETLLEKVSKYMNEDNFEGKIYKVIEGDGVPISYNGELNVKNWK